MTRPIRELKGFKKVFIKSGEETKVLFEIGFGELAFYDANGVFTVEKGMFEIFVGKDCYADKAIEISVI